MKKILPLLLALLCCSTSAYGQINTVSASPPINAATVGTNANISLTIPLPVFPALGYITMTPTGGTVPRPLQDIAGDFSSLLDFGTTIDAELAGAASANSNFGGSFLVPVGTPTGAPLLPSTIYNPANLWEVLWPVGTQVPPDNIFGKHTAAFPVSASGTRMTFLNPSGFAQNMTVTSTAMTSGGASCIPDGTYVQTFASGNHAQQL